MNKNKANKTTAETKKPFITEEKRKELFAKRKYYSEHPEEAKKQIGKNFDGY